MNHRAILLLSMSFLAPAAMLGCSGSIASDADEPGRSPDGTDPADDGPGSGTPRENGNEQDLAPVALRRLTASQYRNTIADVFGSGVNVPALELEPASDGFTSVGASSIGTSRTGVERYETAAASVAAAVFGSAESRARVIDCQPTGIDDEACASKVLTRLGRLLYRRPLLAEEQQRLVALALANAETHRDFFRGLEWAVAALLQSPKFLYRAELGEPAAGDTRRFAGHELASRLAFFLWNAGPDDELLDAAERGALDERKGLAEAALRLLSSDKARRGFRTFFQEYMRLEDPQVAEDVAAGLPIPKSLYMAAREQTLRTFEAALFEDGADIGDVLNSPVTYVNRELAQHYGLAAPAGSGFARVSLPDDGVRAGILGHASFLIKMSNQPHSAPTARGKFVREALLCQGVPPPPDGVVTELEEVVDDRPITMRERLDRHRSDPACANCHALTDPIGLALENFDSLGRFRDKENGLAIDPSGELDGTPFRDARELGDVVSRRPELTACFVRQLFRHAVGQAEPENSPVLDALAARHATRGQSFADLLTELVSHDLFLTATAPL